MLRLWSAPERERFVGHVAQQVQGVRAARRDRRFFCRTRIRSRWHARRFAVQFESGSPLCALCNHLGQLELVVAHGDLVAEQQRGWARDWSAVDEHAVLAPEIDYDDACFGLVKLGVAPRNERTSEQNVG